MDRLREDDIALARATSPAERARQALEVINTGIRLKRAGLRARAPHATEEEIDEQLQEWLERDE